MAKKSEFKPFQNEEDCIQIGEDLTIENRIDRVSIFGSVDITLDQHGYKILKELKEIMELLVAAMEKTDLPENVSVVPAETVNNPFA